MIKLLKKGIRVNGEYYPVWYSSSKSNINGNATIYARTYNKMPDEVYKEFIVENDSDSMTDYFEKDRIRVSPNNKWFKLVEELANSK